MTPETPGNLVSAGNAHAQAGRLAEAIELYQRAAAIQPSAPVYANLAAVYSLVGDLDAAVAAGEQALWLDPKFFSAYNNLANAVMRQGRVEEALALFRRAIELN